MGACPLPNFWNVVSLKDPSLAHYFIFSSPMTYLTLCMTIPSPTAPLYHTARSVAVLSAMQMIALSAQLSSRLTDQYSIISEYMAANRLVINSDKTHLVVMGTKATAKHRGEVTVQAGQHTITPSRSEILLGGQVCQDLKWREHILGSDHSLTKQLTSRVNGLVIVASKAPFATRLSVANGIFMSKLCYLIQLWGGCRKLSFERFANNAEQGSTSCD